MIWVLVVILFYALVFLFVWALCAISADADERIRRMK